MQKTYLFNCSVNEITEEYFTCNNNMHIYLSNSELVKLNKNDTVAIIGKITKVEDVDKLNLENEKIAVINQTTLSLLDIENIYSAIKEKYKDCLILDEICNTTRIRQTSLIAKAKDYDLVLIVGDKTSSNSLSLYKPKHTSCPIQLPCKWCCSKNSPVLDLVTSLIVKFLAYSVDLVFNKAII